jgi:hypothetical protein
MKFVYISIKFKKKKKNFFSISLAFCARNETLKINHEISNRIKSLGYCKKKLTNSLQKINVHYLICINKDFQDIIIYPIFNIIKEN